MLLSVLLLSATLASVPGGLEEARDRQDRQALAKDAAALEAAAQKAPNDAEAHYRAALAASYLSEVELELRDKQGAEKAAEGGIRMAERAVALNPKVAEYYRVLGTLCGQVIPANVAAGLTYGRRAREAIARALELDPKSARAYLARGVGNYYLPPFLGGGTDRAMVDFRRASELDPKLADAWLWMGLCQRKDRRNAEARKAFAECLRLDPNRVWAKQQLDKTPAQ